MDLLTPQTLLNIIVTVASMFVGVIKLQNYINVKFNRLDRRIVRVETHLKIVDPDED